MSDTPDDARKDRARTLTIIGLVFIATVLAGTWYFSQQGQRAGDDFVYCIEHTEGIDCSNQQRPRP